MKSKSKTLRRHSRDRMFERHGLRLTKDDEYKIIKDIQNHNAKFVERQSNRVTVFDIVYEGKILRVVYDKIRKQLITVLSDEMRPENNIP